ncbi:MAG TPA: hypothetical protein VFQ93_10810 [Casimicrobiaceae bacterium]|nr:hypothetical protein [Casimicrobiaceae bacterium]
MIANLVLDRAAGRLHDDAGRAFDASTWQWQPANAGTSPSGSRVDAVEALGWLQRASSHRLKVPVGVVGPRDATPGQLDLAREIGESIARCGLAVICGGRHGVMQAVCEGVARAGGISVGLLPDAEPGLANPYVGIAIATGIGEARNALIARAALCLVAVGDSYGTLSEVALGRQFGKRVIGLAGAARVDGVVHVDTARQAIEHVARVALRLD